jgi:hypothetical protein
MRQIMIEEQIRELLDKGYSVKELNDFAEKIKDVRTKKAYLLALQYLDLK